MQVTTAKLDLISPDSGPCHTFDCVCDRFPPALELPSIVLLQMLRLAIPLCRVTCKANFPASAQKHRRRSSADVFPYGEDDRCIGSAGVHDRMGHGASACVRELHSIVLLPLRVLAIHLRRLTGSPHLSASAHRNRRRASPHVVVASGSVFGPAGVCCRDRHRAAMEMPLILLPLALPRAAMRKLNGSPHLSASA